MSLDDFKIELNYNITDLSFDILKQHINKSYYMLESAKFLFDMERLPDFYSRLYYSCYHIINSLFYLYGLLVISDIFIENKEISSHSVLIGFFNRYFIKSKMFDKNFSALIINFKEFRMKADYKFDEFDKEEALKNYNRGLNFFNVIKDKIDNGLKEIGK